MLAYVIFGGMIATTWVQIIKAILLLGGYLNGYFGTCQIRLQPLALFDAAAVKYKADVRSWQNSI